MATPYEFGYAVGLIALPGATEKQAVMDILGHGLQPVLRRLTAVRPPMPPPSFMQRATQFVTGRAPAAPAVPLAQKLKELAMNRVVKPGVVGLGFLGLGNGVHNAMVVPPQLSHLTHTINGIAQPSRTFVNKVQVLQAGSPVALSAGQKAQLARVGYKKPMWDIVPGVTSSAKARPFDYVGAAQQFASAPR